MLEFYTHHNGKEIERIDEIQRDVRLQLGKNKGIRIRINGSRGKRGIPANKTFHELFKKIADATGESTEYIKFRMKEKFLGYETYTNRDGKEYKLLNESSKLSAEEGEQFITQIRALMGEYGL